MHLSVFSVSLPKTIQHFVVTKSSGAPDLLISFAIILRRVFAFPCKTTYPFR